METAQKAKSIFGDKLYQQRARIALPLLVRQAEAGMTLTYSDFALELEMPNPRNLNYVLGCVGETLKSLSEEWKEHVPPIQCLVVNKHTGLPGEGVGWFLADREAFLPFENYKNLSQRQQRDLVHGQLQKVFIYSRWRNVLQALNLKPVPFEFSSLLDAASRKSGGEGENHRLLKEFVAKHPEAIGLPKGTPKGEMERSLPSGDSLDVSFQVADHWICAEVKSSVSTTDDIVRGLFQCVKYRAVMEAVQRAGAFQQNARAILILENTFPAHLIALKHILGVEVVDLISPY
jgi:hypothetical protein